MIRNRKLFFFLMSLLCLTLLFVFVKNLFVSFLLAFVMYFLLNPVVDFFERRGLSRLNSTLLPFVGTTLVLVILSNLFLPTLIQQFSALRAEFPKYSDQVLKLIDRLQAYALNYLPPDTVQGLVEQSQVRLSDFAKNVFVGLPDYLSSSMTIMFLSPFLGFFLLSDGRNFIRGLLSLVPNNSFELALNLNHQISVQFGGFIRARLIETIIVTLFIFFGFWLLDFPYALTLAIFAGLLNLIPYLGPVIGAVPAYLIAAASPVHPEAFFWITIIYVAAQVLDSVVLVPFLVAKIVDLHPVIVILSIILGSQVLGVLGMIISIPAAAAIKVTATALYSHLTDFRD